MSHRTQFVDETRHEEINALRMQEYATATGFVVDLNALKWRDTDNDCHILAAYEDNTIISTMRGEVIDDRSLLEKKLECPWTLPFEPNGPVLLLSRAATLSTHRGLGLNLVLRYWFLKLAEHHRIPYVMGTFVTDSPRENTLRQMGYQFFDNPLGWQQSSYRSERTVKIVALDMNRHGEQALAFCEHTLQQSLRTYDLKEPLPPLKYVRAL